MRKVEIFIWCWGFLLFFCFNLFFGEFIRNFFGGIFIILSLILFFKFFIIFVICLCCFLMIYWYLNNFNNFECFFFNFVILNLKVIVFCILMKVILKVLMLIWGFGLIFLGLIMGGFGIGWIFWVIFLVNLVYFLFKFFNILIVIWVKGKICFWFFFLYWGNKVNKVWKLWIGWLIFLVMYLEIVLRIVVVLLCFIVWFNFFWILGRNL